MAMAGDRRFDFHAGIHLDRMAPQTVAMDEEPWTRECR